MSVYKYSVLGTVLLVLYVSTASSQGYAVSTPGCDIQHCAAYCDINGNAKDPFDCPRFDDENEEKYCCGDEYSRTCCANRTQAIDCRYEDQYICYSWWIFNWQMALAMLGTVVLLLTVSACCCQCFAHKTNQRAFARAEASAAERRRRRGDVATIEMEETSAREQVFDPSSIHAFQPPDYAKDPPKYQDIDFGGPSGETNQAFSEEEGINPASGGEILPPPPDDASVGNTENSRQVTPPPPYTLYESVEDNEVDIELSAASNSSSPRVIRVSSSPTIVDNTQVQDLQQNSQTVSNGPV